MNCVVDQDRKLAFSHENQRQEAIWSCSGSGDNVYFQYFICGNKNPPHEEISSK